MGETAVRTDNSAATQVITEQKDLSENKNIQKAPSSEEKSVFTLLKKATNTLKMAPDKTGNYSNYKVAIVDSFNNKDDAVDISTLNFPHGVIVQKYITENLPGVQIERFDVAKGKFEFNGLNMADALRRIFGKTVMNGEKYDAINMSVGFMPPVALKDLKVNVNGKDIQITHENIKQYINEVKKAYKEAVVSNLTKIYKKIIPNQAGLEEFIEIQLGTTDLIEDIINAISRKGIKIYIANNNESADKICYSDLIDLNPDYEDCNNPNIITVSANDAKEASSPLSDRKERAVYNFKFLEDGIDITDDGIVDIYDKYKICNIFKEDLGIDNFAGNSFASPSALAKDLKEQADKKRSK